MPKVLDPISDSFYRRRYRRGIPRPISLGRDNSHRDSWAISSAVEHFVDIEGVTSSNLVSPTMNSLFQVDLKHPQHKALARAAGTGERP